MACSKSISYFMRDGKVFMSIKNIDSLNDAKMTKVLSQY